MVGATNVEGSSFLLSHPTPSEAAKPPKPFFLGFGSKLILWFSSFLPKSFLSSQAERAVRQDQCRTGQGRAGQDRAAQEDDATQTTQRRRGDDAARMGRRGDDGSEATQASKPPLPGQRGQKPEKGFLALGQGQGGQGRGG